VCAAAGMATASTACDMDRVYEPLCAGTRPQPHAELGQIRRGGGGMRRLLASSISSSSVSPRWWPALLIDSASPPEHAAAIKPSRRGRLRVGPQRREPLPAARRAPTGADGRPPPPPWPAPCLFVCVRRRRVALHVGKTATGEDQPPPHRRSAVLGGLVGLLFTVCSAPI